MSKLQTITIALGARSDLTVLVNDRKPFRRGADWNEWVDIVVAPKRGLYTADELQMFMLGLVRLQFTQKDDFRQFSDGRMSFGKLYFDEAIGTEATTGTRVIRITAPDVALPKDFINPEGTTDLTHTRDLMRRVLLRVYPDVTYARRAVERDQDVYSSAAPVVAPTEPRRHRLSRG